LQAKEVRLGIKEQLEQVTGCSYGELPPFGKFFSLPLLMDRDLLLEEEIYFNAGSLTRSLVINPLDLQRIEEPILF
jgi:Ala-tRNA(Pro) deacylase